MTKFGPWALLLLRPHDPSLYPPLQEMTIPLTDASVTDEGLKVGGFLCTHIHQKHGRHFWFVEPTDSGAAQIYDSLKGVQQLTVELSRTLHIVGVLLLSVGVDKPILTNAKLGLAAGKVLPHQKSEKPIRVAARSKRQVPRKTKGRAGAAKNDTARQEKSGRSAEKGRKSTTSPKRPLRGLRNGQFRKRCTEDPDDPISEGEIVREALMGPASPCRLEILALSPSSMEFPPLFLPSARSFSRFLQLLF